MKSSHTESSIGWLRQASTLLTQQICIPQGRMRLGLVAQKSLPGVGSRTSENDLFSPPKRVVEWGPPRGIKAVRESTFWMLSMRRCAALILIMLTSTNYTWTIPLHRSMKWLRLWMRSCAQERRVAYTHRVAISNHRLVALSDGHVTFRWRDSAHGNKKRLMSLPVDEFRRRFLLHLLPRGFV